MAEVKPEIKVDPADSPSKLGDIDEFEDDTDLTFPTQAETQRGAWLIKVSEDMWKAWNEIYQNAPDGEQIEVGKLRVYHSKPDEPQKAQIRLLTPKDDERFAPHKDLPKMYNLDVRATTYNNTIVFSEKDLPGHRAQQFGQGKNLAAGRPTGINKNDRYGGGQRKPGTYRTAIPKQITLQPPIVNEAVAKAVEDDTSLDYFKKAYDKALQGGKKTTFNATVDKTKWHPGMTNSGFTFGSTTSKPGKGQKKKKQPKEKAVRMSTNELIDALQQCFTEYQYWQMKTLRQRLRQPEAFIKEHLEGIAFLIKSGDFNGNYKLNDNTARLLNIENGVGVKEESAVLKSEPESDGGTGDEAEDDDNDEMEDVK
ncbi:Transcription initiation factor IIF subunit beta [Fulvia fulva]|uniref:Transcription initiation factor IIF subunit beta n=1 Tax=Passalora fulva TaxID=5499 RepID=A0A9Q8P2N4_PASFU|nr:Transcription initiation factor IIF subunit beta [Fulvia fulva]KAK4635608.1 Transcription initiation factor IIF subunit beta [Fulvia fulva]KAK4636732.1 Transcription initiation factor IIF subunit beta [Fulvia fulva]UJO10876.1 Transcription initiation factor IIF subunit beta [Fulvia fulva]WPV08671.1 Transcription initiation factor IIF subunit beta [Fulvia fulva]WPV24022.1 Transcription initiation factor IIF subunit beta [Fulvia fulva]